MFLPVLLACLLHYLLLRNVFILLLWTYGSKMLSYLAYCAIAILLATCGQCYTNETQLLLLCVCVFCFLYWVTLLKESRNQYCCWIWLAYQHFLSLSCHQIIALLLTFLFGVKVKQWKQKFFFSSVAKYEANLKTGISTFLIFVLNKPKTFGMKFLYCFHLLWKWK